MFNDLKHHSIIDYNDLIFLICFSAKHGFLNCVFNKSKIKCGVEEAIFIKKIAATLSENKLVISTCRYIKLGHCNTAQHLANNVSTIVFNLFIVIWFSKT